MADWNLSGTFDSPQGAVRWDAFGDGPAIVLLHGTPNWSYLWRNVVTELARSHRVYVFDWPGYGRSDRFAGQDISWGEQARRLPELFDHWGLQAPTVVAFDIAGVLALRAHLDGLAFGRFLLLDAAVIPPFVTDFSRLARDNVDTMRQLPTPIAEAMIAAHLATATHRPMLADIADAYLAPWRGADGVAAYWRAVASYDEDVASTVVPRLDELTVPVRLLWGEHDNWVVPAKAYELAAALPQAWPRFIPDAGHFAPEDNPSAVAAEIRAFAGGD